MKKLTRGQMAALLLAVECMERTDPDPPSTLQAAKTKLVHGIQLYDDARKAPKGDQ